MITPNPAVFCTSPWYELHIYWDGSLGFCCQASDKIYAEDQSQTYNVRNMSIREWYNSEPMRQARMAMFDRQTNPLCGSCYDQETYGNDSRRHSTNQKNVIFTRTAFKMSYLQSPAFPKFDHSRTNHGAYTGMPLDIHIDLGNFCNLACKMCSPRASSKIATQYVRWNIKEAHQYINTDWTRDDEVWHKVLQDLADITDLRNVHFMGGETLITSRVEDFVDYMDSRGRHDLNFSFVTNGTVYNQSLMRKLRHFGRINIEVSIESLDATNSYTRQGTNQSELMHNLDKYMHWCDGVQNTVTLRPAISALTIGAYPTLLRFAHDHGLLIKHIRVRTPRYLDASLLPDSVKKLYLQRYTDLMTDLGTTDIDVSQDFNSSDPHEHLLVIANQIRACQSVLASPAPSDADQLRAEMVSWCRRWDDVYGYDARQIFPELQELLDQYGY